MSEIRVCENCNHHNNINNLECEKCGFDLSFVIPIDESELEKQAETIPVSFDTCTSPTPTEYSNLILVSTDGQLTIPISNELVIGRDGVNGSYFEKSNYVSRKHAIFYIVNGEVLIFDASTNGTFVNGRRLASGEEVVIKRNDEIQFGKIVVNVV